MGPQAPIFARAPEYAARFANLPLPPLRRAPHEHPHSSEPLTLARVIQQCVFAAGRKSFTAIVRGAANVTEAKTIIYLDLPLSSEGWTWEQVRVRRLRTVEHGTLYSVERIGC